MCENAESTRRQHAPRDRAAALGWPSERIRVIDHDLGLSAVHGEGRDRFQKLVAAVGLRKVTVLGLEASFIGAQPGRLVAAAVRYRNTQTFDEEGSTIHRPSKIFAAWLERYHE